MKNPHDILARRSALKVSSKQSAIESDSSWSPVFGGGSCIAISNDCNTNTSSYTSFGRWYSSDTGLDTSIVFTGSRYFQVKEIEFFEITD
jgi:hypothetical protein